MSDLESSFELLSSMSPRFHQTSNNRNKKAHKLALKKHFRKSIGLDSKPHSHNLLASTVIVLDDSILDEKPSANKIQVLKAPIIISSTSESEDSEEEPDEPVEEANNYISGAKLDDINNWLSENEKLDSLSDVYSFKQSLSETDDEIILPTQSKSRTNDKKVVLTPGQTKISADKWRVVSIESRNGKEAIRTPGKKIDDENLNISKHDTKNLLDELYGQTWSASRDINLSQFKKKINNKKAHIQTEKTKISDNNRRVDGFESKLKKNSVQKPAKKIDDENLNISNHSAETLLDELYGQSWRENRDKILSNTEVKTKVKQPNNLYLSKTERKLPKSSKPEPKSPWDIRLNNIYSSDSDDSTYSYKSANSDKPCKKLSFSDSEDDSNMVENNAKPETNGRKKPNDSLNKIKKNKTKTLLESKLISITSKLPQKKTEVKLTKTKIPSIESPRRESPKRAVKKEPATPVYKQYSFLKSLSGCIPSWLCDPEAKYFKTNFKTKREELAKKLFSYYNSNIFNNAISVDTPLQWNDRMRGSAGFCYNKRITKSDGTVLRSCRIVLATKVLDTPDRLRDTLVHEMCHAATWLINNVADGHGPQWKTWADKAMRTFPELPQIKRCHDYQINTKYTYKCVDCGYSIGRHSKSLDIERKRCGYCFGKFDCFINKVNKDGEKQCRPTVKNPNGFALYVKENYKSVKRENLKHGDVMKILGRQFAELKLEQNLK